MIVSENELINALKNGEVVGVPTDTVYGLICLDEYKEKVYEIKNRDRKKKLIYFINDVSQIGSTDEFTLSELEGLDKEYWPGTTTLVFSQKSDWISYRRPNNISLMSLLENLGDKVCSTSANISGSVPCVTEEDFLREFPNIKLLSEKKYSKKTNNPSTVLKIGKDYIEKIR